MFNQLTQRLTQSLKHITGQGRLTETNIKETLSEVRRALLDADVALEVVETFITDVKTKALGQTVLQSLNPGQAFVKLVYDEMVTLMGSTHDELNLRTTPPAIILMAGLQGSGKTTSVAKLAHWLKTQSKKSVLVTSTDIYRPAALEQLKTLAEQVGVYHHPSTPNQKPVDIAREAVKTAKKQYADVVLIDTAGRLHIDDAMMSEIKAIHTAVNPIETLFVVDSMTGQDAAKTAKVFADALTLTGVILTKTDGDARGGAALSVRHITGKPIKFMGVGEKVEALERFHPDRVASRILGMGDILTLAEEAQQKVDHQEAEKLAKKIRSGKRFTLKDFLTQLQQLRKLGGVKTVMEHMPGMAQLPAAVKDSIDDKKFVQMEAIIYSMTKQERRFPTIIRNSRKVRIARGSGTHVQDVNRLLKQFDQMEKIMKRMKGRGMMKLLSKFSGQGPGGIPF